MNQAHLGVFSAANDKSGSCSGFSLIELMVVITVLGVFLSLAAPSFNTYILDQKVKNASSDLVAAVTMARSEAIKRNANVTLTKSASGWSYGWAVSAGGTVLSNWGPYSGITLTPGASENSISYASNGRLSPLPTTAIKFSVDDDASSASVKVRCIKIDPSGRPNSRIIDSGSC